MTIPTDVSAATGQVTIRPGLGFLARMKLTEPVRLYLYSLALVIFAGLQLAGALTGEWLQFAITGAGVVLAVGAGGEAVRASVYSPAGVVRALTQVAGQ
jgi:hypothetical protein